MKIGLLSASGGTDAPAPAELASAVEADTELAIYPVTISTFAYTPAEFLIQQMNFVTAGLRAAADGCDVIVYISMADYGIEALRACVSIPVIGAGEATLKFGRTIGRRFSIVTVWPESTNFIHHGLLHQHGLTGALASIRNVTDEDILADDRRPDQFIADMQTGRDPVFDRVVAASRDAVLRDGAEFVILGCTCMSPIACKVADALTVPVINPFLTAVKSAEMLMRLGLRPLTPGIQQARPATHDMFHAMVAAVK